MKLNSFHLMHIPNSYILSSLDSSPKKCMISENKFCSAKKKLLLLHWDLDFYFLIPVIEFHSTKSLFYTPVTFIYQLLNATYILQRQSEILLLSHISCNALLNSITQNPLESHIAAEVFRTFNAPIL